MTKLLLSILKSLFSVLCINFSLKNNKKIIFFYHPSNKVAGITEAYIDKFLNKYSKNFKIIYGHQNLCLIKKKNYFYLNPKFLKFIFNVDYFISSYVSDYFTINSKKIYIHHDIYDTPIVSKDKINQLRKRLMNYDNILVPSNISLNFFFKLFKNFKKKLNIFELGYIKLDVLRKKKNINYLNKNKSIIIAPTNIYSFKDLTLKDQIENIIIKLLTKTNFDIILRPHPSNRNDIFFIKIIKKFSKYKKFNYDKSDNYQNIYMSSSLLITDISGTAYTYAFFTNNPVIFYVNSEKKLKRLNYENLSYFKDRKKIGTTIKSSNNLVKTIKNIIKNTKNISKRITLLREKKIKYLDRTHVRFLELIEKF